MKNKWTSNYFTQWKTSSSRNYEAFFFPATIWTRNCVYMPVELITFSRVWFHLAWQSLFTDPTATKAASGHFLT